MSAGHMYMTKGKLPKPHPFLLWPTGPRPLGVGHHLGQVIRKVHRTDLLTCNNGEPRQSD